MESSQEILITEIKQEPEENQDDPLVDPLAPDPEPPILPQFAQAKDNLTLTVMKASTLVKCPKCSDQFGDFPSLQNHLETHKQPENSKPKRKLPPLVNIEEHPFKCEDCGQRFKIQTELTEHVRKTHITDVIDNSIKIWNSCQICQKSFADKNELELHVKTHKITMRAILPKPVDSGPISKLPRVQINSDLFQWCPNCDKGFTDLVSLRNHSMTQHNVNLGAQLRYECTNCSERFLEASELTQHQGHCHVHICKTCGKVFVDEFNLLEHLKVHRPDPKPFRCEDCGKSYTNHDYFKIHLNSHKVGKHTCTEPNCDKNYIAHQSLLKHIRDYHGKDQNEPKIPKTNVVEKEKPHQCDICEKWFRTPKFLIEHKRTHTGEKPYKCDTCGKTFAFINNFRRHERMHRGEKPFKCDHCPKYFALKQVLERHIQTKHSAERPFECHICHKRLPHRAAMYSHIKTFHENVKATKEELTCVKCDTKFDYQYDLRMHIKRCHDV